MKIISIDASNFLSFGEKKIEISNNSNNENQSGKPLLELNRNRVSVLVGPNGSGKTNIFRLLEFVRKVFINGRASSQDIKQYIRNGQNEFDVSVSFVLDEHDRYLLNTYLILVLFIESSKKLSNQSNNQYGTDMYEFLLKEGYKLIGNGDLEITFNISATRLGSSDLKIIYKFNKYNQLFYQKLDDYYLAVYPSRENLKDCELFGLIMEAKQKDAELRALADILHNNKELGNTYSKIKIGALDFNLDSYIENIKNKIDGRFRPQLVEIYDKFKDSLLSMKLDITNLGYLDLGSFLAYLFNSCVVSLANPRAPLKGSFDIHEIDSQVDKYVVRMIASEGGKYIVRKIGSQNDIEKALMLKRGLVVEELTEKLYKIANSENVDEYNAWLKLQEAMCELLHMKPRFVLENSTAKIIFEEFEDNCLEDQGKKQISFEFAPAGAIELLTVLASVAIANEKVLLLDEPAMNLHPPFQRKLYGYIKKIAETNNAQVIMITHSPRMINPLELESVWRIYIDDGTTKTINVGKVLYGDKKLVQEKKEGLFIRETKLLESLFADAVVLTEGPGEEAALEAWLGNNKDISDKGKYVVIFSVGGKESLINYVSMLKSLNINYFVFCDEETYKNTIRKDIILSELDEQKRVFWAGRYGIKQNQGDNAQNEIIYKDTACYLYELYSSDYKEIQNNYRCKNLINNNDKEDCKNLIKGEPVCKDPSIILAVAKKNKNNPPREVEELIKALVDREKKQATNP